MARRPPAAAAPRRWPPPDRRERIETHDEGGWIATGTCGRPHLVGAGWSWWRCPACVRYESRQRINARQQAALAMFYADETTAPGGIYCPHCARPAPSQRSNQVHMWKKHRELAEAAR